MLLRRVIQHFRNQEWTAIAIDLVIVVVGVYVGIQAQAWNTDRENREIGQNYLVRLHDEVVGMIDNDKERVAEAQAELSALQQAAEILAGSSDATELTRDQCNAIAWSHIYVGHVFVPPTIEELLSTGRLQIIENSSLRSAMVSFSQATESNRQLIADIQTDRLILSRAHPGLITLDPRDDDVTACDFEAMARSPKFLNDVADNRSRYRAYVHSVVVGQQERRVSLHQLLDVELEIRHSDDSPQKRRD